MVIETLIDNLYPPRNNREFRRQIEGSPPFVHRSPSISANSTWLKTFEDGEEAKYIPFNLVDISNQSDNDIKFKINQEERRSHIIVSNQNKVMNIDGIRGFEIENLAATSISAEDIEVVLKRTAMSPDDQLRKRKRIMYGKRV